MTTSPADNPTPEASARTWGGRRPGAGAPRGNRNAARPPAKETARAAALHVLRGGPTHDFLRALPPATHQLVTIALERAVEQALNDAEAQTAALPEEDSDRAQRLAVVLAARHLLTAFADAWQASHRSRDQRESAAVRALRPWLSYTNNHPVTPRNSSQSRSESAPPPTIEFNQHRAAS